MGIQLANNLTTALTASVGVVDTTISVDDTSRFPDLTAVGDYLFLTLIGVGVVEIIRVDGVSGNDLTVVRAQDSTTAQAFAVGDRAELRICAATLTSFRDDLTLGDGTAQQIVAFENLNPGDFVNLFSNAGVLNVRKADASLASGAGRASGYVRTTVTATNIATVYFDGANKMLSGLAVGDRYFLSDASPGLVVATRPTATGSICQSLGIAASTTRLLVKIEGGTIL